VNAAPAATRALLAIALAAGPAASVAATPLDSLVSAERAFAALSVERGMKEAFLTYLADGAVLFRPGPVDGRQVWRARPKSAATLAWAPDYAEVAGNADLGVTSGPWEYRPAPDRNLPPSHGHFISVWKRLKDGAWRVAADIGIEHARPAIELDAVEVLAGPGHPEPPPLPPEFHLLWDGGFSFAGGPGYVPLADRLMARAINDMMKAERDLVYVTRNQGFERAYHTYAAAGVRVYRNGSLPVVGISDALAALPKRGRRVENAPGGHGMSSSHDLGYGHGLIIVRENAAARPDTVSYLHVWRYDDATGWKLALDVENEFGRK